MHQTLSQKQRTTGRFASLMELYESNYVLIRLLVPALRSMESALYVSAPDGVMPLEIGDIEHSRYTTTFNLSYRFSSRHRHVREPDLTVRLYHDARTCEVMSGLIWSRRRETRRIRNLLDGYLLNRFLNKWVRYCLRQGHSFAEPQKLLGEPPAQCAATNPKVTPELSNGVLPHTALKP